MTRCADSVLEREVGTPREDGWEDVSGDDPDAGSPDAGSIESPEGGCDW